MKVRSLQLHNDADGDRVQAGVEYDVEESRALQMIAGGLVLSLERQDMVTWEQRYGRQLSPLASPSRYGREGAPFTPDPRVLQLTQYDPGSAGYRYHSAFNHAADVDGHGGTSAFVRFGSSNPYCDVRQYDGTRQRQAVGQLFDSADVVHVHMDYTTLDEPHCMARWPDRSRQVLVRHYHGSQSPESFKNETYRLVQQSLDEQVGALQIGARLYHPRRYGSQITWIPIPVPFDDYAALRAQYWKPVEERKEKRVRICHSSTNDRVKGTIALDCILPDLMDKGWPIEYVKIGNTKHEKCLAIKASCDITFDSFWLGIQGSGLEAAAMGQPVIAGDSEVRDEYIDEIGYCPYTFCKQPDDLVATLERLVFDEAYRASEAARVGAYVREYHDYAAVGRKYWTLIGAALKERNLVAA
jgi:hypothetical protein